ncbi:aquaporin [Actinoplanes palleronii]|uniref:Transport protein n=1 Tax=Actinoplanes palleronii TaxID=113570 RepID=A0ABQ4B214_9ACTN|nr:MIP/aquaporin family protein [Actinoplanes palleronii]GIE64701.1 transport protein [Actinoplanes palleronii]
MKDPSLRRRLLAEFLGTALLLMAVVGTSAMAADLSPGDAGLRLLQNSGAVALALVAVIYTFGPVSHAHFNPVVSAADWILGRRTGTGLATRELAGYVGAQLAGAFAGTVLGNTMFDRPAVTIADTSRSGSHVLLSEVVATAGLLILIAALVRTGRGASGPGAVGAYIGAACWFTSSTCFANPAVTVARMFTGTEAGIAPGSVPGFLSAQAAGLAVACALVPLLYPQYGRTPVEHRPKAAAPRSDARVVTRRTENSRTQDRRTRWAATPHHSSRPPRAATTRHRG